MIVDTDLHRAYRRLAERSPEIQRYRQRTLIEHRVTPGTAPRTYTNPLFPANYVDRLIRHRLREHTRETIAYARHSAMQMYRMWIFAWDHNTRREWRAKDPGAGVHSARGGLNEAGERAMRRVNREFFQRRIDARAGTVPDSLETAWRGEIITPPIRWITGQKGTTVTMPRYAQQDLARAAGAARAACAA